jgi:hypothetical protein
MKDGESSTNPGAVLVGGRLLVFGGGSAPFNSGGKRRG